MQSQFTVTVRRFVKTFVAAFISSSIGQLSQGVTIHSVQDLQQFGFSVLIASFAGALLSLEKAYNFVPPQER